MTPTNSSIEKSIDTIVEQIKLEKVIPIIGYDLLFNEFEDKNDGDFLMRLLNLHIKRDGKSLQVEKKAGYELINDYYHNLTYDDPNDPDADIDTFKSRLSKTIQEERFNWNLIPESFRKLASIRHFKLFINATF